MIAPGIAHIASDHATSADAPALIVATYTRSTGATRFCAKKPG